MRALVALLLVAALGRSSSADLGDYDHVEPSALTTLVESCLETRVRQSKAAGFDTSTAELLPSCGCVGDWIASLDRNAQKELKEALLVAKGTMFERMIKASQKCGEWEQAADRTKTVYVKTPYSGKKRTAATTWLKFLDCEKRMKHVDSKGGERMRYCDRLLAQ